MTKRSYWPDGDERVGVAKLWTKKRKKERAELNAARRAELEAVHCPTCGQLRFYRRTCAWCGVVFNVGGTAGGRPTKVYCCPEHAKAHTNSKNSGKGRPMVDGDF